MKELLQTTQAYRLLKKECAENTHSHAYLLLCNDSKNLRFALKTFAKLFFQTENLFENERRAKLIDEESFFDCPVYPSDGKKLTVEDAEKIKEESLLSPVEGGKKVFLLADFSEANPQTQNKLLKLLEEPPKGVVFLLGATSVYSVLNTVLSRTKRLELLPFTMEEVTTCLARIYQDKYTMSALSLCAAACGGVVGEAQNMLEGGYYKTLLEGAFSLVLTEEHRLPQVIRSMGETKHKKELLSLLRLIFRDALLVKMNGAPYRGALLLQAEKIRVHDVAMKYSKGALLYAQEAISQAELEVQFNAVFPQCIETCMAKIRNK